MLKQLVAKQGLVSHSATWHILDICGYMVCPIPGSSLSEFPSEVDNSLSVEGSQRAAVRTTIFVLEFYC